MQPLRRSILITFFSTNTYTAIQFGVTLVLARLLTPKEVGIFSITVMLTNIAAIFRDFGVSSYLQREKDLSPQKIRSALGFLLVTSWSLAALIFGASGYAAGFYNEPGVGEVMRVLALSFVLVPFASFFYAVLARNLEAGKQAIVNGVGTLTYAASCLTLAWMGYSYLALAWASVINIAATIVVYLMLKPAHLPLRPGFSHWREIANFGAGAIAGGVIDKVNVAIPDLLLGKISGAHDVGIFSRAGGLVGIFGQLAGPTLSYNMVPFLANSYHRGVPFGPLLAKGTAFVTVTAWPFFICIGVFADDIIRVLYGEKWLEAAPIALAIAIAAAVRSCTTMSGPGLMAIGRPYLLAGSSAAALALRLSLVFLLGAQDLLSFAIALTVADILATGVCIWQLNKYLSFSFLPFMRSLAGSVKVCLPVLFLVLALRWGLPQSLGPFTRVLIMSALVVPVWFIALIRFRHPLTTELPALLQRFLPARFSEKLIGYLAP